MNSSYFTVFYFATNLYYCLFAFLLLLVSCLLIYSLNHLYKIGRSSAAQADIQGRNRARPVQHSANDLRIRYERPIATQATTMAIHYRRRRAPHEKCRLVQDSL